MAASKVREHVPEARHSGPWPRTGMSDISLHCSQLRNQAGIRFPAFVCSGRSTNVFAEFVGHCFGKHASEKSVDLAGITDDWEILGKNPVPQIQDSAFRQQSLLIGAKISLSSNGRRKDIPGQREAIPVEKRAQPYPCGIRVNILDPVDVEEIIAPGSQPLACLNSSSFQSA